MLLVSPLLQKKLIGKHCRRPIAVMGVVDHFGQCTFACMSDHLHTLDDLTLLEYSSYLLLVLLTPLIYMMHLYQPKSCVVSEGHWDIRDKVIL